MLKFIKAICLMPICVTSYLQNQLVAIQLWTDAFMITMILFQSLSIEFCYRYTSILSTLEAGVPVLAPNLKLGDTKCFIFFTSWNLIWFLEL